MKALWFLVVLIAAIVSSFFLTYYAYGYFMIERSVEINMSVKVGDHFGLNADSDSINFGMVMPGTSGERLIIVNNSAYYPLKVTITKSGRVASWVGISENNFILKQNGGKKIIFEVTAPPNTALGAYSGKVSIIFKRILRQ